MLLDHVVALVTLDNPLDVRTVVAGPDGEVSFVGAQSPVLVSGQSNLLRAEAVGAFADEREQQIGRDVEAGDVLGRTLDHLVRPPEQPLVLHEALSGRAETGSGDAALAYLLHERGQLQWIDRLREEAVGAGVERGLSVLPPRFRGNSDDSCLSEGRMPRSSARTSSPLGPGLPRSMTRMSGLARRASATQS